MLHSKFLLMRSFVGTLAACALFNLAGAQTPAPAADSKPADTTAAGAAAAGDKAADPTVVTAKVAAPTATVAEGPSAETLKAARSAGYQVKGSGAKTRFCKSETTIGKRIPEDTCLNEEQFTQKQMRAEQDRERLKSTLGSSASSH